MYPAIFPMNYITQILQTDDKNTTLGSHLFQEH
jgi:hypothetical protein